MMGIGRLEDGGRRRVKEGWEEGRKEGGKDI
jgi:hypothetical protein